MSKEEVFRKISQSKKYKNVYPKTIERVLGISIKKYGEKQAELKSRNLIHQIWGAYYPFYPDFNKLLDRIGQEYGKGQNVKDILSPVLQIHASTKERFDILNQFYSQIFEITGKPNSIVDIGCGLNPLTIYWMNLPDIFKYIGYDIDKEEINFLNQVFQTLNEKREIKFMVGDIFTDDFEYADIVFLFKLLPLLHLQEKNSIVPILEKLKCKFIVISFPIKSLSGKEIGMEEYYSDMIEILIKEKDWKIKKLSFRNEIVYIIEK